MDYNILYFKVVYINEDDSTYASFHNTYDAAFNEYSTATIIDPFDKKLCQLIAVKAVDNNTCYDSVIKARKLEYNIQRTI